MNYEYTDGCNQDFITLCHELDEFLNELAGGEEKRSHYIPYNKLDDIHDVIVLYDDNIPVGCASFKHFENTTAEVKRVFIRSEYRGRGISKRIMELLEKKAKDKGYNKFILESGEPLINAMRLYRKIGYYVIPNFGQYKELVNSICLEKIL